MWTSARRAGLRRGPSVVCTPRRIPKALGLRQGTKPRYGHAVAPTSRSVRWIAEEFDRRAAGYDSSTMHRWQAEHVAELLDPQPGQRILDIATGTGRLLVWSPGSARHRHT